MLRKLGSPRKGSRFAAATATSTSTVTKDKEKELSSFTGDTATTTGEDLRAADAKGFAAASGGSKKSKKTTQPLSEEPSDSAAAAAALTADTKEDSTLALDLGQVATPNANDQQGNATTMSGRRENPPPLLRTPRTKAAMGQADEKQTQEEGGGGGTTPDSDAKTLPSSPSRGKEKDAKTSSKPRSKRDSLGLRSLMAKRDKTASKLPGEGGGALSSPANKETKKETKNEMNATKQGSSKDGDEEQPPPLSPIRRKQRPSMDSLAAVPDIAASSNARRRHANGLVPPTQQPEVHIIGEITCGNGFVGSSSSSDGFCCKWSVDYGNQWTHISGDQLGQTQIDYPVNNNSPFDGDGDNGQPSVVWAHPIDLHFVTTAFHGWPKLLLQVWHVDSHMAMNVVGYGFVHLPYAPGSHRLRLSMWRPLGTTKEELEASLFGHTPELMTDEVLFNTAWADRCRLKTVATGCVQIDVGIILRNFHLASAATYS